MRDALEENRVIEFNPICMAQVAQGNYDVQGYVLDYSKEYFIQSF
jgi:hypothetical protein